MTIVGFLQNYNGVTEGHLQRCLTSMRSVVDYIVVYDDASTENVWPLYKQFNCLVIPGIENNFKKELYHKQQLLYYALILRPDWLVWFDSDAILGSYWQDKESLVGFLEKQSQDCIMVFLHNLNLWRSPSWYRTDRQFNDLWHAVFWRNTGELHYSPVGRLHQKQFPRFFHDEHKFNNAIKSKAMLPEMALLHYGFATSEDIAKKYFTYRTCGQTGDALTRLVSEKDMMLEKADPLWFPERCRPVEDPKPEPIFDPETMAKYASYEEWYANTHRLS